MEKIKLLLVDDQTLFVESLRIVLNVLAREIVVTGVASNGQEALELVEREDPDVVLLDVRMPVMDGVECVKEIRSKFPNVKVLMLTTFDDDQYVAEALESGAAGYLLKDVPPPDLIAAVRAVHQGGVMLSPKVATKLVELAQTGGDAGANRQQSGPSWLNELNNREKEILRLLAQGFENREIAHQLYIAEQTVKNYVSIIYCKMGVRDRVHATRLAIEAKLV